MHCLNLAVSHCSILVFHKSWVRSWRGPGWDRNYFLSFSWNRKRIKKKFLYFWKKKKSNIFLKINYLILLLICWKPKLPNFFPFFWNRQSSVYLKEKKMIQKEKDFSNFSCMFLNPNNYFQFEFELF